MPNVSVIAGTPPAPSSNGPTAPVEPPKCSDVIIDIEPSAPMEPVLCEDNPQTSGIAGVAPGLFATEPNPEPTPPEPPSPSAPSDELPKPVKCDNELRSFPASEPKRELGKTKEEWDSLVKEFERFIYVKTQGMKRDPSFVQMLTGLRGRWLKKKDIEDQPIWFADALMQVATDRISPSQPEVDIAEKLSAPNTRFGLRTVNNALRGEVFTVNGKAVMNWGYEWAKEIRLCNYLPMVSSERVIQLPTVSAWFLLLMWTWFLLFDPTCWYFVGQHWTPESRAVYLPWWGAYYSEHPGPQWLTLHYDVRMLVGVIMNLGWWYQVFMWLRRGLGCLLYLCKDYTRDGYWRTFHNGWALLKPGNG